ncbi:APC family permease [Alteromonas gilva]|uniref:APC family permease n=1 Tax=Alteromonas gilva TaxID=2987522 RepID=A0ABT5L1I0_9ALTE|nr:APC family permease [Alteromonas gilva]MDC8830256.1 APC family permease [Alteromonas gilva]
MKSTQSKYTTAQSEQRRLLGLPTMLAICVGLVIVQGSMISVLQGVGLGGGAFFLAMLCALLIAQCNAMSFAELSLMFPGEGTLATYTQKALGHFPAIVAVFAGYVVVAMFAIPVEMFLVQVMLSELIPGFAYMQYIPLLFLGLLMMTNLIGADVFAKVQNILAFVLVAALILVGSVAISGSVERPVFADNALSEHPLSFAGIDSDFIGFIALAMWIMVGVEFICPMIDKVKHPVKNIPRAMQLSLMAIFLIFVVFAYGATLYLPSSVLIESPIPFLAYTDKIFGETGLIIATVLGLAATCSTINTVLASVPRMLHGMALQGQAFPQLLATNRYNAPWVATVLIAGLTLVPYLLLDTDLLIIMVISATSSWLIAYIIAHINVIKLRYSMPGHARPYRSRFFPVPQLVGIVAMVIVLLNNAPEPAMSQKVFMISGSILFIVGVIALVWVKFYMKKNLFEPE